MTTTQTAVTVADAGPEPGATDPAEMRQRAGALALQAYIDWNRANAAYREADQLEHEADFWEKADEAEDALNSLSRRTAGLETAADEAVTRARAAEDQARKAGKHLARVVADAQRFDAPDADLAARDNAAVRVASAQRSAVKAKTAVALAKDCAGDADAARECAGGSARCQKHADEALEAHRGELRGANTRCYEALAAALSPGRAPRKHPNLMALGSPDDMTVQERQNLALTLGVAHLAIGGDDKPQRRPSQLAGGPNWRADVAAMDPARARVVSNGRDTVIIPPVPAPGR